MALAASIASIAVSVGWYHRISHRRRRRNKSEGRKHEEILARVDSGAAVQTAEETTTARAQPLSDEAAPSALHASNGSAAPPTAQGAPPMAVSVLMLIVNSNDLKVMELFGHQVPAQVEEHFRPLLLPKDPNALCNVHPRELCSAALGCLGDLGYTIASQSTYGRQGDHVLFTLTSGRDPSRDILLPLLHLGSLRYPSA